MNEKNIKLAQSHELLSGAPITVDGKGALQIVNTNDTPLQAQLLKLVKPAITNKLYRGLESSLPNLRGI